MGTLMIVLQMLFSPRIVHHGFGDPPRVLVVACHLTTTPDRGIAASIGHLATAAGGPDVGERMIRADLTDELVDVVAEERVRQAGARHHAVLDAGKLVPGPAPDPVPAELLVDLSGVLARHEVLLGGQLGLFRDVHRAVRVRQEPFGVLGAQRKCFQ